MSWWSKIFPSTKSADSLVKAAIDSGDALFYTEEEKEAGRAQMREWYIKLLGAMQPFNVAMRALAFIVGGIWAIHLIVSTVLYMLAVVICAPDAEVCRAAMAAASIDNQLTKHINSPFYLVMVFYFGAAGVNGAIRTWQEKK
ncbi:hypothetical protein [Gilvimarinus chinensis]|uniref:hypothetical protein n=1 Tax=Gilvimarinus chinensis TaxID=396005 RepID=UPI00036C4044|nr:hypothetical protein [Gilvimarinus chinensis]